MIKLVAVLGVAVASMAPAAAWAEADEVVVVGVPDGGLAAASLMSRDYENAARRLAAPRPDEANDPARLINLGNAYAGLGRMQDAHKAYRSARFAPEMTLTLANGQESSSRDIARVAMGRLETSYAMR
ncbi:tetratricopeptide repeat protein [Sphingobium sp. ZW T5_29]|uniref:tetratricopeptide repeat protein n=1 Tax=Sphingobium sp. ZW T5_29 TaxID=3378077 RepID=UPI00385277C2